MNQDVPWTWVAMIAIAFVSWIFNRIQEATAERQRAKQLQRRRAESRDEAAETSAPPPLPPKRESGPIEDPREVSLRKLVEALGGAPQQPVLEPERPAPPPLPKPAKSTPRASKSPKPAPATPAPGVPLLTAAERAALERLQAAPMPGDSFTSGGSKKASSSRRANAGLPELLRSPSGLRQAIVLKELLDKPVSLR